MRRMLVPASVLAVAAGLGTTAPAGATTLGSCVSLDESCYAHQCDPDSTVDERLWWHDTGPIIHICL